MKLWSKTWKSSKKARKQRKYIRNAPLHIRNKFVVSHLSGDLRKKYSKRSMRIRKGDKVKVMKGNFNGKIGSVEMVDTKKMKVYITGLEIVKKDGSKALFPIHPSNLLIQEINKSDKKRLTK